MKKNKSLIAKLELFAEPSSISVFVPPIPRINSLVLSRILPSSYFLYIISSLFLLGISPIAIILFSRWEMNDDMNTLAVLLVSVSFVFILDVVLAGIYFIKFKLPFLQEWKDKLGFK